MICTLSEDTKAIKRGRINLVFAIIGIALSAYFISMAIYLHRLDAFTIGLIVIGLLVLFISLYIHRLVAAWKRARRLVKCITAVIVIAFLASVVIIEGLIISCMNQEPEDNADYVVILGCQVHGDRPSPVLARRVDAAIDYLKRNDKTEVIATGGMGPGEDISEAEAMRRLLVSAGIDEARIHLEDKSTTTLNNLRFADELYGISGSSVVLVSTDYHMFRAESLARKLGYSDVSGLPSRSQSFCTPVHMMREYVGIVIYVISGNI